MSIVRRLLSYPIRWQRPSIAGLLPLFWFVWLLWPPQPDFSFEKPAGLEGVISADGSRVVFLPNQTPVTPDDNELKKYQFTSLDVQSLIASKTTAPSTAVPFLLSTDGTRIALMQPGFQWKLISLISNDEPISLPAGSWSRVRWSMDGRFVVATDDAATVVVQASDGLVVFETRKAGEVAEVLPDGTGMFAVSRDGRQVELWKFDTGMISEHWPVHAAQSAAGSTFAPNGRSRFVERLKVSRDGNALAALVRCSTENIGTAVGGYVVVTWDRKTGRCSQFEVEDDPRTRRYDLDLSDDGGIAIVSILGPIDSGPTRFWRKSGANTTPVSAKSVWMTWNVKENKPRPEIKAKSMEIGIVWQSRTLLMSAGEHVRILDESTGRELRSLPRVVHDISRNHQLSASHGAFLCAGQKTIWLPYWVPDPVANLFEPVGYFTELVRLSDGKSTRTLLERKLVGFDVNGQLWTEMYEDGHFYWERWSPETPRPWWLYALTAAGVGYLIWPALVRLTSRWRPTRPAGVAA